MLQQVSLPVGRREGRASGTVRAGWGGGREGTRVGGRQGGGREGWWGKVKVCVV